MKLFAALCKKLWGDVIIGIVIAVALWGIVSYWEIIMKHHDTNPQYSRYNIICMYTNMLDRLTK